VKLFPGCHLNLRGSGVGVSFGGRGAHIGIRSRGQRYVWLAFWERVELPANGHEQAAVLFQYTADLAEHARGVTEMFQTVMADDQIEAAIFEG
jgi:hypothetical protein